MTSDEAKRGVVISVWRQLRLRGACSEATRGVVISVWRQLRLRGAWGSLCDVSWGYAGRVDHCVTSAEPTRGVLIIVWRQVRLRGACWSLRDVRWGYAGRVDHCVTSGEATRGVVIIYCVKWEGQSGRRDVTRGRRIVAQWFYILYQNSFSVWSYVMLYLTAACWRNSNWVDTLTTNAVRTKLFTSGWRHLVLVCWQVAALFWTLLFTLLDIITTIS